MLSKLFIHFKIKNIVSIHHKTCMQFWNMKLSKPWHLKYLLETKQFPAVTTEVSKVRVSPSSCTNHLCMDVFHRMRCHTLPGAPWHHCHTKLHLRPPPWAAGRCSCRSCQWHPSFPDSLWSSCPPVQLPVGPAAALPAPNWAGDRRAQPIPSPGTNGTSGLGALKHSFHFTQVPCTQHRCCQLTLNFKKMKMS